MSGKAGKGTASRGKSKGSKSVSSSKEAGLPSSVPLSLFSLSLSLSFPPSFLLPLYSCLLALCIPFLDRFFLSVSMSVSVCVSLSLPFSLSLSISVSICVFVSVCHEASVCLNMHKITYSCTISYKGELKCKRFGRKTWGRLIQTHYTSASSTSARASAKSARSHLHTVKQSRTSSSFPLFAKTRISFAEILAYCAEI